MSYNVQDKLTFVVEIQKRGDTSFLTKLGSDINAALAGATKGTRTFATETTSSMNSAKTAIQGATTVYNAFGKSVSASYSPLTQWNAAVGKSASIASTGVAANQKLGASYAVLGNNAKSSISTITQFDTTVRRSATTMNAGVASATAYSAIFKTIPLSVQASTAALNANSGAVTNNASRMQQADAATRNAIANTTRYNSVLAQESAALNQTTSATAKLSTAQERQNQSIIQNARGASTLVLSFAMLNSAATDYRINQESMADINQKVADAQERLTTAIERYGEGSFQAEQASDALAKAQRGLRFELREQQNQLNNMLFLYILIGQEIVSSAVPAILNFSKTIATVRSGVSTLSTALGGIPAILTAFGRGADRSADAISNIGKAVTPTNKGISILSSSFASTGREGEKFGKALTAAEGAGNKFRGGLTKMVGLIGGAGGGALGAGLVAAGVGLALYSANTNGARDAVNQFGVVIGSLNPVLKGIGDGLVGVAGSLGLTGETATQTKGHFEDMNKSFDEAGKGYAAFVDSLLANSNIAIQAIGVVAQTMGMLANPQDIIPKTGDPEKGTKKEDMTNSVNWLTGEKTGTGANDQIGPSSYIGSFTMPGQNPTQLITGEQITDMRKFMSQQDKLNALRKEFFTINQQNTPEYIQAEKDNVYWNQEIVDKTNGLISTGQQYDQVLRTLSKRKALENLGYQTANIEMKANALGLIELTGKLNGYEDALETTAYKNNLMTEGVQKQREAFIGEQQQVHRLTGTYSMLADQVQNQNALDVAYSTGILETNIALLEREKAISKTSGSLNAYGAALASGHVGELAYAEGTNQQVAALQKMQETVALNSGVLDTYHDQIEEGTILSVAHTLGMQEQEKAALDLKVANSTLQGTYDELNTQLAEGEIQMDSFNKGFLEQEIAIKNQHLALSEASGALAAYNNSIRDGEAQTLAFTEGTLEMARTQAENYVALSKSQGALETYMGFVDQGVPQYNAFAKAANDAMMTIAQMPEQIAGAIGSYQVLSAAMNESQVIMQKESIAYHNAKEGARQWGDSLIALEGAQKGQMAGLSDLADQWGVHIPQSLKMTAEGAMGVIEAFSNMEGAAVRLASAAHQMGLELLSGVTDAIRDGGKEVNETIDSIEERLGFEVPDGIKEAWESAALGEAMVGTVEEGIALLQTAWATGNTEGVTEYTNNLRDKITEDFNALVPEMQTKVGPIMDQINTLLSEGPDENDPNGMIVYMNRLMALAPLISQAIDPMASSIDGLNSISLEQAFGTMEAYRTSIQETAKVAIDQFNKMGDAADDYMIKTNKLGQSFTVQKDVNTDNAISLQGMENAPPLPITGKGGQDTGAQATIDTAIASLDQLQAKVDEVMAAVQAGIATGMASAFTSVSQYTALMQSNFGTVMGQMINTSTAAFTAIGAASSAIGLGLANSFGIMQAAFGTILGQMINTATAAFTAIGASANTIVAGVTTAYNQANSNANGVLAIMQQQAAQRFAAIGNSARVVAVNVTTHYNTAEGNADGVLNIMETRADEAFAAIGESARQVPEAVDEHFGKAADDGIALIKALETAANKSFESMAKKAEAVAKAVEGIGTSADSAKKKVDALASAVNALKDIKRTITYTIKTVGSAPAGAGSGIRAGAQGFAGLINMAEGGEQEFITEGLTKTVITGESGDEFVRRVNKRGEIKEEIVRDIKSFSLNPGDLIQVQPLQGQYAKNFMEKYGNIINMASGQNWYYQNQNGVINTNIPGLQPDSNGNGQVPGSGSHSPFNDVTAFPTTGSTIGNAYSDGTDTVFTADPYNRNLTSSEWGKSYLGGNRWYDPMTNTYSTGATPAPGTGTGGGNGNNTGGSVQVITTPDGRVVIKQGNGQQSIIIDGKEMLPSGGSSSSTNTNGVGSSSTNNSFTDENGNNFNNQNDTNNDSNYFDGATPTNSPVGNTPAAGTTTTTGGTNQNFNYQNNDLFYEYTNGAVRTNMTAEQIAAAEAATGRTFPKGTTQGGGTQGPGSGQQIGKIWNMQLGNPTMMPEQEKFKYKNDPTGWANYGMIPDPLYKEKMDRADVLGVVGGGGGTTPPGNGGGFPGFDFTWIAELLRKILGAIQLGRNTQVNISGNKIMEVVQSQIMDGFSNFM
jgi:hypothetical protein